MTTTERLPGHLKTAREANGLTQAQVASALGLSRPAVTNMENGQRGVSSSELHQLARLYGRSLNELLEGSALDSITAILFRRDGFDTPEARLAVRRFMARCRAVRELETLLHAQRPMPSRPASPLAAPASLADAIAIGERIAARERERLGLGTEPIRDPIGLVENQGVCVGRLETVSAIDGVYFNAPPLGPCVGVNDARDPWTGYRTSFTVIHEYAHWLMDALQAEPLPSGRFTMDLCERRADAFAAAFLMPRPAMHRFFGTMGLMTPDGVDDDLTPVTIVRAMRHFGVSRLALLTRLRRLALIRHDTFNDATLRNFPLLSVARAIGVTLKAEHALDARFTDLITQAWANGLITTGRAADLRGLELDDFRAQMDEIGVQVQMPNDMLMPAGSI
jgi:Zn-dependent peptidase ImmA (M78 family)/DNA-binding XRE family transcriptional regulator